MTSFYVGPGRPRLNTSSWGDLVSAVESGATRETQWCELKADVPASSGANTELAKDLASLTVDGGVLLIGIRDKAATAADIIGVDDASLDGLSSRIDQVAGARVSPPMTVVLHPVSDPSASGRSVLVVEVPKSASAPHMVGDVFWGRSATGKRPLSEPEVAQLIGERARHADLFDSELVAMEKTVDPLPIAERTLGRLYVMAKPVNSPRIKLGSAIREKYVLQIVAESWRWRQVRPQWATGFGNLNYGIAHPDGHAAATYAPAEWNAKAEPYLHYLLLRDDGAVQYVGSDAIRRWGGKADGSPCISLPAVCEAVQQVANIAAHLSTEYLSYAGQWRLGLHITSLRGLYPSQAYQESLSGYGFTPFQTESYTRTSVVSIEQMTDPSSVVVEAVAADLARGLRLDRVVFPYTDIAHMARKLAAR
jgi:hypothetical protein